MRWLRHTLVLVVVLSASAWLASEASAQPQRVDPRPAAVDFGGVDVGSSRQLLIEIHNIGGLPLTVNRLTIAGSPFSVNTQGPFTFGPGAFWAIRVGFAPVSAGQAQGTLTIDSNDPARPMVSVPLTGTGLARRVGLRVQTRPSELRLGPGDRALVSYTVTETAGVAIEVRSEGASLVLPDGRAVPVDQTAIRRMLRPFETITIESSVAVPLTLTMGGTLRLVREFVAERDGARDVQTAALSVVRTGSLGADFTIGGVSIEHPIASATLSLGSELHPRAYIFGTGSGSAIGAWVVDDATVETFSITLSGGRSATVEMLTSLPTTILGTHRLALEIRDPVRIRSGTVRYLVTPRPLGAMRWVRQRGAAIYLRAGAVPEWEWSATNSVAAYEIWIDDRFIVRQRDQQSTLPPAIRASLRGSAHRIEVRAVAELGDARPNPAAPPLDRLEQAFQLIDARLTLESSIDSAGRLRWTSPGPDSLFVLVVRERTQSATVLRKVTALQTITVLEVLAIVSGGGAYEWWVEALNDVGEVIAASAARPLPGSAR